MSDEFICAKCGYRQEVEAIIGRDGSVVTMDEYVAALRMAGMVMMCSVCAPGDSDG